MSWEKVRVTVLVKPAAHGSGLYLRVPKNLVEAYSLWAAETVEYTLERVKKPAPENATPSVKRGVSQREGGGGP